jgi:cytochrome P450
MTTTEMRKASIFAMCEVLGVPRKDWHFFARWAVGPSTPKALDELYHYVDVMIADRCHKPGDDLVSRLIQLDVDGEELTTEGIHNFVAALVAAAG